MGWFNVSDFRLVPDLHPPVGPNATLAYVGAHRTAEDAISLGPLYAERASDATPLRETKRRKIHFLGVDFSILIG